MTPATIEIGKKAPKFKLKDQDDRATSLADLEGAAAGIEGTTGCGSVPCYLTSARTGQDVETLFRRLAEMVTG